MSSAAEVDMKEDDRNAIFDRFSIGFPIMSQHLLVYHHVVVITVNFYGSGSSPQHMSISGREKTLHSLTTTINSHPSFNCHTKIHIRNTVALRWPRVSTSNLAAKSHLKPSPLFLGVNICSQVQLFHFCSGKKYDKTAFHMHAFVNWDAKWQKYFFIML